MILVLRQVCPLRLAKLGAVQKPVRPVVSQNVAIRVRKEKGLEDICFHQRLGVGFQSPGRGFQFGVHVVGVLCDQFHKAPRFGHVLENQIPVRRCALLDHLHVFTRHNHIDGTGQGDKEPVQSFRWEGRLSPVMRQHHVAGERVFVDYAGHTVEVVDAETGEVRQAQVFVGVLGASSYTYAEATWTQTLPDWIGSHVRMLAFFGGVPGQVVSDNLKSGVTKACFYEPGLNRTYAEMAAHYDTVVIPARPRKPRDKAKAEVGVQVVERWILAQLRKRRFFSLAEMNAEIATLLTRLNEKVTRHLGASRRGLFEQLDKPALQSLPATPYEYAEWLERRAGLDYHVEVEKHYYSVPHQLLKKTLWARLTAGTVEIYHDGERVASHIRSSSNRRHTTVPEHMPASHRRHAGVTPGEIRRRAARVGPNTAALVEQILHAKTHPEQGFRACLGIVRLVRPHGHEAVEAACERATEIGALSYSSVKSILKNNLHRRRPRETAEGPAITHHNIRGAKYFH